MTAHTYRWRFIFALLLGAFMLAPICVTQAQSLNDGWKALDDEYRGRSKLINALLGGKTATDPGDKKHVEALDLAAKYDTYRVYLDHLEVPDPKQTNRPSIDRVFKDFERNVSGLERTKETTKAAAEIYRDKVRLHALEVIQFDKAATVHKIHNARILAEIARLGQPQLAETLVTVLKDDKQNDGVRYYALRGLRNLLALSQPMQSLLNKDQEAKTAEALLDFLEHKQGPPKGAAPEEIDGFCVLRREVIRALALMHTPAVSDKVRPALTLARFAGGDGGIQPPPRIDERMEAAVGLARMQSAENKEYQADYAAWQIGHCLGAFAQKANEEKEGDRTRPWKIDAYRLSEALDALKEINGKNTYVVSVVNRGKRLLGEVMKGSQANTNDVTWFLTPQSDPPSKELFKGAADTVVKPAEEPAEK
ncbi:MAG TPA: hypothetical protein VH682_10940 [Gemmataceae bacterium]|jgi:hypothetical protein